MGAHGPAPHGSHDSTPPAERGALGLVCAVALAAVAASLAALGVGGGRLWGADAYAFLPGAALGWGLGAGAALTWLAFRRAPPAPAPAPAPARRPGRSAVALGALLVAAAVAFWWFRIRHVLLGDGIPITALLPDTHEIHPREPLAALIQSALYRLLLPAFAHPGVARTQVVQDCVAVGSVVAGVGFVVVARALAAEIARSFPARDGRRDPWLVSALTVVLLAQGYVQVFFGYVENYAFPVLVAALYVLVSLRFLRGVGSIAAPLSVAALGVALDFTGIVLGPSVLVLVGVGLLDASRRRAVVRDLLVVLALTVAALAWLDRGPAHYPVVPRLLAMLASGRAGAGYLLSIPHLRDFLDEHLLLGPFGLLLFVPLAAWAPWTRAGRGRASLFLIVAGLSLAWACWATPDLPLGYARDWDLFAPLGVVLTAAALALAMATLRDPTRRWRAAAILALVSLFHTAPWIALNTSETRSVRRFATLPLGGGRTENTIALWFARQGRLPEAKQWLRRALTADPQNSRALDLYGRIAFEEHDARRALQAYLIAVTLRPDKPDFRAQLAAAVAEAGGPDAGLRQVDTLLAGHQDDGGLWLERAMLLRAAGREPEADEAQRRALRLRPDLAAYPLRLPAFPAR